jgi:ankyrin repeat protein
MLLDHGGDPNAYYMAGHALYGTLVGVAGEGEQEATPHPRREGLYELLLERGAELYDIQVLYNTHFSGDMLWWLELTYAHAARTGRADDWKQPGWPMLDMGGYGSGARFVLAIAIAKNGIGLAEWALHHGADPDAPPPRAPSLPQTSLYEYAVRENRPAIADLLVRHGANRTTAPIEDEDEFVAACLRLDMGTARRLVQEHPEYLASPRAMFAAAARDSVDVIQLLLELGTPFDVADVRRQRPLHVAAAHGATHAVAHLIARGADVDAPETQWNAPPIGFAAHHGRTAVIDILSAVSRDVWHLAFHGSVERLREVLADQPARAQEQSSDGVTPLWWLPDDETRAVAVAALLLAHGADPSARSKEGTTAEQSARRRGLDEAADLIAAAAAGRT